MKRVVFKPRDPFVQHLVKKKQGAHMKSAKAIRSQERAALKKQTKSID
jgi:hypothetical protein